MYLIMQARESSQCLETLFHCAHFQAIKIHSRNSYRLISFLNVLSKVLEKHIYALIINHLEWHYPLSDCQWDFRTCYSAVSTLLLTIHEWLQSLESGKGTHLCCLPQLQKGIWQCATCIFDYQKWPWWSNFCWQFQIHYRTDDEFNFINNSTGAYGGAIAISSTTPR